MTAALFSAADFVMVMIIASFDLGDPASPYYDEAWRLAGTVPGVLRGVRIASTDPLVIETWSNAGALDAENAVSTWWPSAALAYAVLPTLPGTTWALMLRGEENGGFAFTAAKSTANEVEQTNLISGPSLAVFATELAAAAGRRVHSLRRHSGRVHQRGRCRRALQNLAEFARRYGHYYISTGPYFLSGVFPVEGQAVLSHYAAHPDPRRPLRRVRRSGVPRR
jgi:peptide/nickel transport system substrate-binding protein